MRFQRIAAFVLVMLFSLAQAVGSDGMPLRTPIASAHAIASTGDASDLRADKKDDKKDDKKKDKNDNKDKDEDEDEDEDDDDNDCSGSVVVTPSSALAVAISSGDSGMMLKEKKDDKKKDSKDKKDKNDNKDEDDQDEDEGDDGGCSSSDGGVASAMSPATMPIGDLPTNEVTGTSTGGDGTVALIDERVVLRIFPWMPSGIRFKMRFVDPATVSSPPGKRVGNMVFRIEAQDASGSTLDTLPAEVNLSARYADRDVAGASEQNVTLSRMDSATSQWKAAPKIIRVAENNYVAASIVEPGTYVINIP